MDELIEYIARNLVLESEAVRVERVPRNNVSVYRLSVAPTDMGRVIGRQGRVATAIRMVMQAAPIGQGRRCVLDIQERL